MLIDGVTRRSLFSARQPTEQANSAGTIPEELPKAPRIRLDESVIATRNSETAGGRGELALMRRLSRPAVVRKRRRRLGEPAKSPTSLKARCLSVQLSVGPLCSSKSAMLRRDRLIYIAIGFVRGAAIAVRFFRSIYSCCGHGAAADRDPLALVLSADRFRSTCSMNVMTPLIMGWVLDSMQITSPRATGGLRRSKLRPGAMRCSRRVRA